MGRITPEPYIYSTCTTPMYISTPLAPYREYSAPTYKPCAYCGVKAEKGYGKCEGCGAPV